jgi:hypothetical protein
MADDFGMQNTLLISPELFDEHISLRLGKMIDLAHSCGIRVLLHSCGNIGILIPRLIDLRGDILDPLQPENMKPFSIKEKIWQLELPARRHKRTELSINEIR